MAKEIVTNAGTIYSVLTADTAIVGNIATDNDIRIDGRVEGDVDCKGKLVMGPQSYIKGNINCVNAEVLGQVDGDVAAVEMLTLRSQAVINGAVKMATLMIEPNARLNGLCSMNAE